MKLQQLIGIVAVAFAPLAAYADQGDKYLEEQLATPRSTLTRGEVLAQLTPRLGQQHVVDLHFAEASQLTRAEVQRAVLVAMALPGGA